MVGGVQLHRFMILIENLLPSAPMTQEVEIQVRAHLCVRCSCVRQWGQDDGAMRMLFAFVFSHLECILDNDITQYDGWTNGRSRSVMIVKSNLTYPVQKS